MDEFVNGMLHGVYVSKRVIAIKKRHKVYFYYMSKGMFRSFMMYFTPGMYVFLKVSNKQRIYKGLLVQNVISIEKILKPRKNHPVVYYDVSIIKSGIKKIVNESRYKIFIDFEMSMPPYTNYENFVSEIIQVGYVFTNPSGEIIEEYRSYIKPILFPELTKRAIKFLHISQEDVDNGISYVEFYNRFIDIFYKYDPIIYVWGSNDQLELNKMNKLYKLKRFTKRMRFINLLKLHKNYFGLKNDMGLFNAYNLYSEIDLNNQKHDAMEDALITKKVFDYFKAVCNNEMQIEVEKKVGY